MRTEWLTYAVFSGPSVVREKSYAGDDLTQVTIPKLRSASNLGEREPLDDPEIENDGCCEDEPQTPVAHG